MNVSGMLDDLNREIARLTHIRDLLGETTASVKPGPGRPKGPGKKDVARSSEAAPTRRTLSAEAREKIAAAQRKRWAAGKKAGRSALTTAKSPLAKAPAAKKSAKKAVPSKKAPPDRVERAFSQKQAAKTSPPAPAVPPAATAE